METNKVVVTLNKGVDVDSFIDEMNSLGNTSAFVPNRKVEIFNLKEDSLRNVDFVMTRDEMNLLEQDPRVAACRWGTKAENGLIRGPNTLDSQRVYPRTNSFASGNIDMNWGIPQTNNTTNQYSSSSINYSLPYTLTGNGVDFVIQDTGLQCDHPEFQDEFGNSRVNQIDWFAVTGVTGTLPATFYTDVDGHGTNVCGIAAGKTYGLAKHAEIYVMNILGFDNGGDIPSSQSFNLLRIWHQNKTVTSTGYKRPTVVNMSWGYSAPFSLLTGGNYRGTNWSGSGTQPAYGVINNGGGRIPYIVASEEADIEDCLDAGVILIGAAGNSSFKIDVPGGIDYDNYCTYSSAPSSYYMRGATPNVDPRILKVGAVDLQYTPTERKANFSCCGPGVDIWAAGDYIVGPTSTINNVPPYPVANYPFNASFKSAKISGTSQASPQVSGLACCMLEARPFADIGRVRNFIMDNSTQNRLTSTGSSYTDLYSLQGGPNNYLYNPFHGTQPTVIEDLTATIYGTI
jgi:hypothetical protein